MANDRFENRPGLGQREDDDAAAGRQAQHLLAQMGLDPGDFTVWCDAGRLSIRGLVDTAATAERLQRLLGRLDGVTAVDALLPVDPGPTAEDAWETDGGPAASPGPDQRAAARRGDAPGAGNVAPAGDVPDVGNVLGLGTAPASPPQGL